ncbi:epoxide hydrolase family protein [Stackebrandtia nassauensis]|uniref:Epoxide hydrolase domain protein n=1 Tax=Stackebrandtia nassauensis (strain DSM 44728 / CIP 108903 / NRRL B-16338 / NBRC 102104 / LLR-40K-21) TaxID=446470 RepID=D3QAQ5_STANL|nr:epoxide hydrolase family protein [Stackebrandtia nassauensis]ADD44701.1 Epoxide hydrolase domain protein [Stackebrandtia nassauensis DSM 44728]
MTTAITPFRVDIPQADLDDLADRLDRARWPQEPAESGSHYGIPRSRVTALAEYWRTDFDWRAVETALNAHPQFTTEIDGQNIHFIHVRAADPDALPLILTHGWPGSVIEFLDVIEPLSRDFQLVIPSIPGFGFSGPTSQPGWDVARVARAWAELMRRLGYERYGAQGGDWGSAISRVLGDLEPERVVGVHLNYLTMPPPPGGPGELSGEDTRRLDGVREYLANQPVQRTVHSIAPQLVGYGLNDSPIGLLAWLLDRFDAWADPASKLSPDKILADVSLYWLTGTAASAPRIHRDSPPGPLPCPVPLGVAVFAREITLPIRSFAEAVYDIRHWREYDHGGHFAAMEVPELFTADVREFFGSIR